MSKISRLIFASVFVLASSGYAQNISGSMAGRIVDQQGAAVPGASVTTAEPNKKISVTTKTNDAGEFVFPGLQPGNYTLTVEAAGFKKLEKLGIPLDANDKLDLGAVPLQVGAVSESVEVSAQVALLQTESAERSEALISKQMENIEVNGRNPLDLAKLVPGVVDTASSPWQNTSIPKLLATLA